MLKQFRNIILSRDGYTSTILEGLRPGVDNAGSSTSKPASEPMTQARELSIIGIVGGSLVSLS